MKRNGKETDKSICSVMGFTGRSSGKTFSTGEGFCFLLSFSSGDLHAENESVFSVQKNMLLLLPPSVSFSVHTEEINEESFLLLWINAEVLDTFFSYLDDASLKAEFLKPETPKRCILSGEALLQAERGIRSFIENHADANDEKLRIRFFVSFLISVLCEKTMMGENNTIPFWLENACQKMKKKENFVEGISKMVELSGRTREHLSRSMKKHKGQTVSEFINELRLDYAANMLIQSDMHIVDLCYESGFSSLDYFGKQFKLKYGISPSKFRSAMQKN